MSAISTASSGRASRRASCASSSGSSRRRDDGAIVAPLFVLAVFAAGRRVVVPVDAEHVLLEGRAAAGLPQALLLVRRGELLRRLRPPDVDHIRVGKLAPNFPARVRTVAAARSAAVLVAVAAGVSAAVTGAGSAAPGDAMSIAVPADQSPTRHNPAATPPQ